MGEPSFGEVLAELRALRSEVDDLRPLRSEVESLRRQVADGTTPPGHDQLPRPSDGQARSTAADEPAPDAGRAVVDRRAALRTGLIAAGAAAIAIAADAQPAAAASGSSLVLGSQANACTGATIMAVNAPKTVGLGVWDVSRAALLPGYFAAIEGHAKGTTFNVGVEGYAEGTHLGVRGVSDSGTGVSGQGATGVAGVSPSGGTGVGVSGEGYVGVDGSSNPASGLAGVRGSGFIGVLGKGAIGVSGRNDSTDGLAVEAEGSLGTGIVTRGEKANLRFEIPSGFTSRGAPTGDNF
ncbi:MAG: hypothetical protein JWM66_1248, partial [Solirubrobacterales bacterium]|nr:hypothetical protein [Solirubrobacterales bacterium]